MDIGTFNERSLKFLFDDKPLPPEARLPAGLHSILHYPDYGTQGGVSNDIFAVGRFPTILHYDRRMFPKLSSTVYSGARLCGLTSLPYRFSSSIAESRRKGLLSIDAIAQSRELLRGRTLVTCGEYNTKGSLELYGLDNTDVGTLDVPRRVGDDPAVHMRNRQTASGSKILSVVNHGTRIAFSDGSGYIKWVERDGFTEVRRIRIGNRQRESVANMFAEGNWASQGLGDLARKLLPINLEGGGTEAEQHRANEKDLLFWTGEALGYVAFAPRQAFSWEDFMGHDAWRTPEEQRQEEERTKYHERMIRALYRQADEAMLLRLRHEADG